MEDAYCKYYNSHLKLKMKESGIPKRWGGKMECQFWLIQKNANRRNHFCKWIADDRSGKQGEKC